jgi:surface antigen
VLERGYTPALGAIMVFGRTARMHVGHVAVVNQIVSSREILIDQANWHHGRVDHGVSVIDTSAANDWSSVQVEWEPRVYGGPFPITGFIYAQPRSTEAVDRDIAGHDEPRLIEASSRSGHVRIIRGMGSHHVVGGHLVLADETHMKKPTFRLAATPARAAAGKATPAATKSAAKKVPAAAKSPAAAKAPAKSTTVATHTSTPSDKAAKHVA